jgi:hypothetical protein
MARKPTGDELLDSIQERPSVAHEEHRVRAGEFHVAGGVDVLGDVPTLLVAEPAGVDNHQRRHPDRAKEVTHVNLEGAAKDPRGDLRRHRHAFAARQPACEPGVAGRGGSQKAGHLTGSPAVSDQRQGCLNGLVREPVGIVVCRRIRAAGLMSTNALVRSGWVAANCKAGWLAAPSTTTRSQPSSSSTTIMSSTTLSSTRPSSGATGSDEPIPRESNHTCRLNDDRPLRNRTSLGSSHSKSRGKNGPLTASTSGDPAPTTW